MSKRAALIANASILVVCLAILCAVMYPVFDKVHPSALKSTCQGNMRETLLAFKMYTDENDYTLPSSEISRIPEAVFRGARAGTARQNAKTLCVLLSPYQKDNHALYCPSDPRLNVGFWIFKRNILSKATPFWLPSSYVLKKAINDVWLDPKVKARKMNDYNWPSDQITFYERGSFHWGNSNGDLSDPQNPHKIGATANCAFLDGHVKTVRLTQFEPDYYNTDGKTGTPTKRPEIDPRRYCDTLN